MLLTNVCWQNADRDPVQWVLSGGSSAAGPWIKLHAQTTDFPTIAARSTFSAWIDALDTTPGVCRRIPASTIKDAYSNSEQGDWQPRLTGNTYLPQITAKGHSESVLTPHVSNAHAAAVVISFHGHFLCIIHFLCIDVTENCFLSFFVGPLTE